jgi:hypothetical protein
MRAKSPKLSTKKQAKMGTFLNKFFSFLSTKKFPQLVNSRKKPFPPILPTNEVTPKAQCTRKLPDLL